MQLKNKMPTPAELFHASINYVRHASVLPRIAEVLHVVSAAVEGSWRANAICIGSWSI